MTFASQLMWELGHAGGSAAELVFQGDGFFQFCDEQVFELCMQSPGSWELAQQGRGGGCLL